MNYLDYENACKNKWKKENFGGSAELTPDGADKGVDLLLKDKYGHITYGQCKHYTKNYKGKDKITKIPVRQIRELKGAMARDGVNNGIFYSPIPFTKPAAEEAKKDNIWYQVYKG